MKIKHPLSRMRKKNRNIITGLICALAALAAVTYYLGLPGSLLLDHFLKTLAFVLITMLAAVVAVVLVKGVGGWLRRRLDRLADKQFNDDQDKP